MSCRQIEIDLYLNLSSPLSFLTLRRVRRVFDELSFQSNFALRCHFVPSTIVQLSETDGARFRAMAAAEGCTISTEGGIDARVAEEALRLAERAQTLEDNTDFAQRLLSLRWQTEGGFGSESLCRLADEFELTSSTSLADEPVTQPALPAAVALGDEPLCAVGKHIYLRAYCSEAQYRAACNRIYDIWVECGDAQDLFEIVEGER